MVALNCVGLKQVSVDKRNYTQRVVFVSNITQLYSVLCTIWASICVNLACDDDELVIYAAQVL